MSIVLVTGSSRGIGFETALAFARAGHRVAATMRSPDKSPELARTAAREKLAITAYAMDVDDDASVRDGIARIVKELGPIDILVNNAGIERMKSVEETLLQDARDVMETNYFGAIRCIQAVMPSMRTRRSGCIINVTSVAGKISLSPMATYAASKFALEALSEALAQEAKTFNVRVVIVEPGIIATDMATDISKEQVGSPYSQKRRISALYRAVLKSPVPAAFVADAILEIAKSDSPQLRYPVGPDAIPFLGWRSSFTDEQWTDLGAADDDAWYARIQSDFGVDARAEAQKG